MKNKLLRLVSLMLCLGMILCTVGCGGDASTTKKKKKKIIVKKRASSSVSDDVSDNTSDVFDWDDYDEDEDIFSISSTTSAKNSTLSSRTENSAVEGRKVVDKEYTVNGTPLAYVTTANTDVKFRKQNDKVKVFNKGDAALDRYVSSLSGNTAKMTVEPSKTYQTIQGFGASMTQSSVYNMEIMPEETRDQLMTRLFDPENGIGLSILRQPIGCGDYNYLYYTYDEVPEGQDDFDLEHFDFTKEITYPCVARDGQQIDLGIIPYIQWAQRLNPDMMFVGSVWTAPRWMKTRYSWNSTPINGETNMLRTECYDVYSRYVIKSLKAFKDNGVEFYMFTPQNELTGQHGIPATYYDSTSIGKLVNQHLYDDLKASGLNTKLFAWDFNWFENDILLNVGAQYGKIDGIAMHFYSGEATVMNSVHEMFPDLEIFLTEAAGNDRGGQPVQMFRQMMYMHECYRYNTSAWILWNLCLDKKTDEFNYNGPGGNDGAKFNLDIADDPNQDMTVYGTGLTEYDATEQTLVYQMDFYVLAHFSKFIHRGAKYVESTDLNAENALYYDLSFINEDGSAVVVIGNEGSRAVNYVVEFGDKVIVFNDLAGQSLLTLVWDANTYIA